MKKLVLVLGLLTLTAAAEARDGVNSDIYFNKRIRITESTKFVVLPFELTASWAQTQCEASTKRMVENKNSEKFEISLLDAGVTVIERNKLDKVLSEQTLSKTGLTEYDSVKIGKLLSADIVVLGTIPMWTFYEKTNKGFIEILIKGVVVETGEIVFKAVFDSQIVSTNDDFRYDMAQLLYKAYDAKFDRTVSFHVVDQDWATQKAQGEYVLQTARAGLRFRHPGLLRVYDFGTTDALTYLVTEYIPGSTLAQIFENMRDTGQWTSLGEAVQLSVEIAQALDYIHLRGLVHGELQPGRVSLRAEAGARACPINRS